ncbi:MAG: hypothetical protein ACE5PV_13010 [Candidatus Poribacteria bacterium]
MAENGILELELPIDKLNLLQTQAQYKGKDVDEFVTSIIDEWLYKEQLIQTMQKKANSDNMDLASFTAECRKLKERIRQRGVLDTGDSVEILREIREERSNR